MKPTGCRFVLIFLALTATGCSGGGLTTREKGAGVGALGGAAVGGIIGAAVGHPGAGRGHRRGTWLRLRLVDRRPAPGPRAKPSGSTMAN